jgi:hypothetical protein
LAVSSTSSPFTIGYAQNGYLSKGSDTKCARSFKKGIMTSQVIVMRNIGVKSGGTTVTTCVVVGKPLGIYDQPTTDEANHLLDFPPGHTLIIQNVVHGPALDGHNPRWGHSNEGEDDIYFWLGGTNRPNG